MRVLHAKRLPPASTCHVPNVGAGLYCELVNDPGGLAKPECSTLALAVSHLLGVAAITKVKPQYAPGLLGPQGQSPGERIAAASNACEAFLAPALQGLLPGSSVVSHAAVSARPALRRALSQPGDVWLLAPLEGTANFAHGRQPCSIMVTLIRDGRTTHGWMFDPIDLDLTIAVHDEGAWLHWRPLQTSQATKPASALRGAIDRAAGTGAALSRVRELFGDVSHGTGCTAADSTAIVTGALDFSYTSAPAPWDHAPGCLLLTEAQGVARHLDGTDYSPAGQARPLLTAANEQIWQQAAAALATVLPG